MYPFTDKRLIAILLALTWAELSLLPLLSFRGIKPDLFFIFLTFYAFQIDWKHLVTLSLTVGIIRDVITNTFFGLETSSIVMSALLLRFFVIQLDRNQQWIQIASLFIFSWMNLILFMLLTFVVTGRYHFSEWLWVKMFLISIYTTAAGFLVFPFLERWLKATFHGKQYELFR